MLRINSAACGTGCHCQKQKAICADVVCAPQISSKFSCIGVDQCDVGVGETPGGILEVVGVAMVDYCRTGTPPAIVPGTGQLVVAGETSIGTDAAATNLKVTGSATVSGNLTVTGNVVNSGDLSVTGELISQGITPPANLTIAYAGGTFANVWNVTSYTPNGLSFDVTPSANVAVAAAVTLTITLPPLSDAALRISPTFSFSDQRTYNAAFSPTLCEYYASAAGTNVFVIGVRPTTESALWPLNVKMGFNVQFNIYKPA